jgi:hypothetical protein
MKRGIERVNLSKLSCPPLRENVHLLKVNSQAQLDY